MWAQNGTGDGPGRGLWAVGGRGGCRNFMMLLFQESQGLNNPTESPNHGGLGEGEWPALYPCGSGRCRGRKGLRESLEPSFPRVLYVAS